MNILLDTDIDAIYDRIKIKLSKIKDPRWELHVNDNMPHISKMVAVEGCNFVGKEKFIENLRININKDTESGCYIDKSEIEEFPSKKLAEALYTKDLILDEYLDLHIKLLDEMELFVLRNIHLKNWGKTFIVNNFLKFAAMSRNFFTESWEIDNSREFLDAQTKWKEQFIKISVYTRKQIVTVGIIGDYELIAKKSKDKELNILDKELRYVTNDYLNSDIVILATK